MILLAIAVAAGAITLATVVLCDKSKKTGSKSNVDNIGTSTNGVVAAASGEELSKELSSLETTSRISNRGGGGSLA
ncbi:hypothetical protein DRF75_04280 [Ehrlichia minasensis]|uniref:Uncharacterized protein n=1 Tax=Ehrlichia minasensis TaxID=1242993 RepID=A0A4Q6I556_9RICK|nr:hypothetical protein [Ehrlichia minasensis]RZB12410.1 hypothetical protein DRF75_04280 [Ehrlichia minasensis]